MCVCKRWPFDWKTPFGYALAWIAQGAGLASIMITVTLIIGIIFGSCWLFIAIAEDITNDMTAFNRTVETSKYKNYRAEMIERFCDVIQNYTEAKQ